MPLTQEERILKSTTWLHLCGFASLVPVLHKDIISDTWASALVMQERQKYLETLGHFFGLGRAMTQDDLWHLDDCYNAQEKQILFAPALRKFLLSLDISCDACRLLEDHEFSLYHKLGYVAEIYDLRTGGSVEGYQVNEEGNIVLSSAEGFQRGRHVLKIFNSDIHWEREALPNENIEQHNRSFGQPGEHINHLNPELKALVESTEFVLADRDRASLKFEHCLSVVKHQVQAHLQSIEADPEQAARGAWLSEWVSGSNLWLISRDARDCFRTANQIMEEMLDNRGTEEGAMEFEELFDAQVALVQEKIGFPSP